jgi:LPS-assembly protein
VRRGLIVIALLICTQAPRVAAQAPLDAKIRHESGFYFDIDERESKPRNGNSDGHFDKKALQLPPIDPSLKVIADKVVYDDKRRRFIAQGNVEIHYNDFILNADELILDRVTNKLTAEGKAKLKTPDDEIIRADRLEAIDEFRDVIASWFAEVLKDDPSTRTTSKHP